jgi:hypothetical protein
MEVFSRHSRNKERGMYAQEHGFSVCDNFIVSVGLPFEYRKKSNLNKLLGIITATTLSYVERERLY